MCGHRELSAGTPGGSGDGGGPVRAPAARGVAQAGGASRSRLVSLEGWEAFVELGVQEGTPRTPCLVARKAWEGQAKHPSPALGLLPWAVGACGMEKRVWGCPQLDQGGTGGSGPSVAGRWQRWWHCPGPAGSSDPAPTRGQQAVRSCCHPTAPWVGGCVGDTLSPRWGGTPLLCGAGRARLPHTCPGKGERFGHVLAAKNALGDATAGHPLPPPCWAAGARGWERIGGFLGCLPTPQFGDLGAVQRGEPKLLNPSFSPTLGR